VGAVSGVRVRVAVGNAVGGAVRVGLGLTLA
jgi:hypothetical protein